MMSSKSAIAGSLGRVGSQIAAFASQQSEREDALQAAEADAHLTTSLAALRRQFETDPDYQTFEPRFMAEADRLREEAASRIGNESLRRRWMPRATTSIAGTLDSVLGRGRSLRAEAEFDRLDTTLSGLGAEYLRAPDDDTRSSIRRNIEDTIELGRRSGIVSPDRIRTLRARHLFGVMENDALSQPDRWATYMELTQGDARAGQTSTGNVSDIGLSHIQRMLSAGSPRPPGSPPPTRAETQAELRRLRNDASRVSEWLTKNAVTEDGQPIPLTQLQLDALVGFALSRAGGDRAKAEDTLSEILPSLRTGNWESVASVVRGGSLAGLEQPAPPTTGAATVAPAPGRRPPRFATDVDSAIVAAAQQHGLDPDLMRRIAAIESGGDPRNVTGSYRGLFQLSDTEFAGRGDIFNAADNANAAAANFVRHIADFRQQHGRDPTAGELYLIHQQGAGGFAAHMAQPGRLAWRSMLSTAEGREKGERWARQTISGNLPPSVLARLGGVDRITSQQFMDYWRGRVEGGAGTAGVGGPPDGAPDPRLSELGDMMLGQAPSSRYAQLPPDRRGVLINRLAEALRPEIRQELDSDIDHIRHTGQPRTLPDGTTWIDRARRAGVLTRHQLSVYERRINQARAIFAAVNGMSDMSPEGMATRLDELDTSRVPEGESYTIARQALDTARRAAERINRLRQQDPALWASGSYLAGTQGSTRADPSGALHSVPAQDDLRVQPAQEVMEAYRLLARRNSSLQLNFGQDGSVTVAPIPGAVGSSPRPQTLLLTDPRLTADDRRLIIDARIAAMERVGIPVSDRRILRSDEAATLLGLPANLTSVQSTEFNAALRRAAQRAEELFGPRYARAAFDDALRFRQLNDERRRSAASIARGLPPGANAASALDREEALWRFGYQTTPPGFGVGELDADPRGVFFQGVRPDFGMGRRAVQPPEPGWFSSTPQAPPPGPGATIAPPGVSLPKPTPEDIAALLQNPRRQAAFDRTFGPGLAAQYLMANNFRPGMGASRWIQDTMRGE